VYHRCFLTLVCVCVGGLEVGFVSACSWLALVTGVGGYVLAEFQTKLLHYFFTSNSKSNLHFTNANSHFAMTLNWAALNDFDPRSCVHVYQCVSVCVFVYACVRVCMCVYALISRSFPLIIVDNSPQIHNTGYFPDCVCVCVCVALFCWPDVTFFE